MEYAQKNLQAAFFFLTKWIIAKQPFISFFETSRMVLEYTKLMSPAIT